MSHVHILETAFVKYLLNLTLEKRAEYLRNCMIDRGELAMELADHFDVYDPVELAKLLENLEVKTI